MFVILVFTLQATYAVNLEDLGFVHYQHVTIQVVTQQLTNLQLQDMYIPGRTEGLASLNYIKHQTQLESSTDAAE